MRSAVQIPDGICSIQWRNAGQSKLPHVNGIERPENSTVCCFQRDGAEAGPWRSTRENAPPPTQFIAGRRQRRAGIRRMRAGWSRLRVGAVARLLYGG